MLPLFAAALRHAGALLPSCAARRIVDADGIATDDYVDVAPDERFTQYRMPSVSNSMFCCFFHLKGARLVRRKHLGVRGKVRYSLPPFFPLSGVG
ncbi:MAG TPA: hypothetical protein DCF97_13160 [Plesiomonas shigelloides]|nr:hypothetical protein [Plesiomonas shigelloides]